MKRPEHIEPGKWGTKIVFYKPITKTHVDQDTGQETEDQFFVMRQWSVFSADQVEGAEPFRVNEDEPNGAAVPDFAPAETLITRSGADIRYHGDHAYYKRPVGDWPHHHDGDYIVVPPKHRFNPLGAYYESVFHELAHWSEIRCEWTGSYSMGELIAEMAASFLSTEIGVPQGESLENHASYLSSWLEAMKGDPSYIFTASTQASKVCDFLMAFVQEKAAVA
jgi:antirestriction protein ArdC